MEPKIINSMYTPAVTYTYPGRLNTELITPISIQTPALTELFRIVQGIRCGEYLHLIQPLTTVLSKPDGTCNPTYTQSGSITDRQLLTAPFVINLEWCEEEFAAVCNALSDSNLIGDGVDGYELGGRLQQLIFEQILDAARRDIFKVIFFGQSAYSNSSIYSSIDGVWTKFFDSFGSYCVEPVYNAWPKTATSTLPANSARDRFRELWGQAHINLKQLPANQKVIWVTGSVWENYYDSLINDCCVEGSWQAGQDGITTLRYRGVPVLPIWIADEALQETGNPYYNTLRHFAIYTTPQNHVVGVERSSDLNNLTMCFDCRTNSNLIKGKMRFGYNFIECNLQAIAY